MGLLCLSAILRKPLRIAVLAASTLSFGALSAQADQIRIVALGASNATGEAVGMSNAYPSVLQSMLRAKGYDVTVVNMAVNGATSAIVLARVDSAVTPGTKVVIFDVGLGNDRDAGAAGQSAANRALIERKIRALGAVPIFVMPGSIIGAESATSPNWIHGDPHHHYTVEAHRRIAAAILPRVIAALGKKK